MHTDLQKASVWKRVAAWIFDWLLISVLAVGFAFALSSALGYDSYNETLEAAYADYEAQYGISFAVTQEEYLAMTEQERQNWDAAYQALIADQEAMHAYDMAVNLMLLMTTVGILLAILVLEFAVPLLLKNGQTVGKKVFGLGLVRTDGVRMNTMQLFVRTLLGKFTIETMIPVYILLMMFWGTIGIVGPVLLAALLLGQVICVGVTRNNCAIHDLLAGTAVVDLSSQRVFTSSQELIEYTKKIHAERAARQDY